MFEAIKLIVLHQPEFVVPIVILLVGAAVLAICRKAKSRSEGGQK